MGGDDADGGVARLDIVVALEVGGDSDAGTFKVDCDKRNTLSGLPVGDSALDLGGLCAERHCRQDGKEYG